MAESLVNKTLALGGCLLFDFLKGESAAAANRSICSVIGYKSLEYLGMRPCFDADIEKALEAESRLTIREVSSTLGLPTMIAFNHLRSSDTEENMVNWFHAI
ncbi:unnamed protein product [Caenorhabditis nigoni]